VRWQSPIFRVTSLLISSLYWLCILSKPMFWPLFCPWRHSVTTFVLFMLSGAVLGVIAGIAGSRLWFFTAAFAVVTLFIGTSTL
jgi:hypothetical protein